MSTIKEMLQTVEIEQRKKLEQLSQQAAKYTSLSMQEILEKMVFASSSSVPIVAMNASMHDLQYDHKSSSMVEILFL